MKLCRVAQVTLLAALLALPAAAGEDDPGLTPPPLLVVDGMNVIGSRPDGWWRDRDAAVARLLGRLQRFAAGAEVAAVFDGFPPPGLSDGERGGVLVFFAHSNEPDAADDRIVKLVGELDDPARAEVVTSDRALAERVRALGASVSPSGRFLDRLDSSGY